MYVLGIDGGGTKTTAIIANASGHVLALAKAGPTNPRSQPMADVTHQFERIRQQFQNQGKDVLGNVHSIFCGVAGVASNDEKQAMKEILHCIFGPLPITVDHDAISALYSGTIGAAGIVSVSGTGSITYGRNERGEVGRVGGWGYLIGDDGSGFSIGRAALRLLLQDIDLGNPPSALSKMIVAHYGLPSVNDVKSSVYSDSNSRAYIASAARVVGYAAGHNVPEAIDILTETGMKLAANIVRLAERLFSRTSRQRSLPVVLTGSVYNSARWIQPEMEKYVRSRYAGECHFVHPQVPPVVGALLRGFEMENIQAPSSFLPTIKRALERERDTPASIERGNAF